jgi:hypothetical protein
LFFDSPDFRLLARHLLELLLQDLESLVRAAAPGDHIGEFNGVLVVTKQPFGLLAAVGVEGQVGEQQAAPVGRVQAVNDGDRLIPRSIL